MLHHRFIQYSLLELKAYNVLWSPRSSTWIEQWLAEPSIWVQIPTGAWQNQFILETTDMSNGEKNSRFKRPWYRNYFWGT